ncbi:hypothetical protein [uncultured Phascolarctobacterium sp.]|uniref:hypothetical protein n=1 Tax=uncultured Phascolarctobacterium sp. TaxID=512296 RepID=UPI0025E32FFB|nr:hypothetical protein [uncultured Phascolarctobacterium sp.]
MSKNIFVLTADIKEKATTKFGFLNPTTTSLLYALIIILGIEFVKGVRGKNFIFFCAYLKNMLIFDYNSKNFYQI